MQNYPFIKIKIKEPLGLRLLSLWESHRTAVCGFRVLGILTKGEMIEEGFLAEPSYFILPIILQT